MAAVGRKTVGSRVIADAIVPECNVVFVPLEAGVYLRRCRDELVEEGDDMVRLSLRDADDLCDEAGVEEDGFPTGHWGMLLVKALDGGEGGRERRLVKIGTRHTWIRAHERMLGGDGLTPDSAAQLS